MALDKEYFDSIYIDLVKKKYYNANKVNAVFDDIKQQAETLTQENELLARQLEALNGQKTEIGDVLLSAQALANRIVEQARAQAESTIRQAQERADKIVREANAQKAALLAALPDQQEYAARCVEQCLDKLRQQQLDSIDFINAQWQSFLCSLMPEEPGMEEAEEEKQEPPASEPNTKVTAIARELGEILDK